VSEWLAHKVQQRILQVTEDIMCKWRLLVEGGRKTGYTLSQPDLIIAATALEHGLTLVSRDTCDYRRAHVPVIKPALHSSEIDGSKQAHMRELRLQSGIVHDQ